MAISLILIIIAIVILYIIFKPYFVHYHTTLLFTGELGGGKTLNGVKATRIYKKFELKVKIHNWFIKKINNIITKHNIKISKYNTTKLKNLKNKDVYPKLKKTWNIKEYQELPRLITNIPVRIRKGKHELWSTVLTKEMLLLKERIPVGSVVLIDEIPQLVNQFNWNLEEVVGNLNEFATFFRHYIGGLLILTAQSDSQVVKQLRDKMNQFYWLTNFKKFLFIFYKCDCCQFISSDVVSNVNTGFIEDNTKTIYGLLIPRMYDSRCYSTRYDKLPPTTYKKWHKFKTNKIIRFGKYKSPLDEEQ